MRSLAILIFGFSAVLGLAALGAGVGNRLHLMHFRTALQLFFNAGMLAPYALVLSVLAFVRFSVTKSPALFKILAALGALIALAVYWPVHEFKQKASSVPRIHDISTDTVHPPQFVNARALRTATENSLEYGGPEIARQQAAAYPDIRTKTLSMDQGTAFDHALATAKNLGWEITSADRDQGRIEAVDTTPFFGFKDDVAIRLTKASPQETLLDIRSVSRVGISDVGANAARIRRFLAHF